MFSKDGYVHAQDTITVEDLKHNFGFSERQIAAMYSHFAWIITRLLIELGDDMVGKSYDPLSIDYKEGVASSYLFTPRGRGFNFKGWEKVESLLKHAILDGVSGASAGEMLERMIDLSDEFS